MNRRTVDQGGSVSLVHVASSDWPSLPSSPPPVSSCHSRDRRGHLRTERHVVTDGPVVQSFKFIRLKWRHCEWSYVCYGHNADLATKAICQTTSCPGGSLWWRTRIAVIGRHTDLLSADMGVRIIHRSTDFYTVTKI